MVVNQQKLAELRAKFAEAYRDAPPPPARPPVARVRRIAPARPAETATIQLLPSAPFKPVPPAEWPAWARAISLMKSEADAGVGDTFKRSLGVAGTAYEASMKLLGMPCGCSARREDWNTMYPYNRHDE